MTGFFDRMLGRNPNKGSGSTAKDRLKFVLLHERVNIAPEKMREMKQEIIAVIAKYVPEVDPDSVDIAFEQSDRYNNKIVAEIPFTKARAAASREIDENDDYGQDKSESDVPVIDDDLIAEEGKTDSEEASDTTGTAAAVEIPESASDNMELSTTSSSQTSVAQSSSSSLEEASTPETPEVEVTEAMDEEDKDNTYTEETRRDDV